MCDICISNILCIYNNLPQILASFQGKISNFPADYARYIDLTCLFLEAGPQRSLLNRSFDCDVSCERLVQSHIKERVLKAWLNFRTMKMNSYICNKKGGKI